MLSDMLATCIFSELSTETCIVRDLSFVAMPPRGMLVAFTTFIIRGTVMGQVLEDGDPAPARCALDDDACQERGLLNHTIGFCPEDPPLHGPHTPAQCCQPDPHQGRSPFRPMLAPRRRLRPPLPPLPALLPHGHQGAWGEKHGHTSLTITSRVPEHPHHKTKSRAWTRRRLLREQWKRSWTWSGKTWATYGAPDKKSRWKCW